MEKETWYQGQNELMLELVLERYEEGLDLSEDRLHTFIVEEDKEAYASELLLFKEFERKVSIVKELLCYEKETRCNQSTSLTTNKGTLYEEEIVSRIVE